jgi:putative PIN family toxin of toxin-antitoxin system
LAELRSTLARKSEWSGAEIEAAIRQAAATSELVFPNVVIEACRDPDDNRVLECAVAGGADLILTGDKDLLVMNPFRNISILTVRQFLDSHGA